MPHRYRVTVEPLDAENTAAPLVFETANHDELFSIVERIRAKAIVPDDEAASFAIGLKLFTETMLHHRNHPLFANLAPHIGTFMKKLKATPVEES
ncbi:DUF3861 domain-containing protein [Sphingomonas jeddahensis]|uniref:DUF3861 domain-containing protein n=1 Tax=Sphingomonas jeddahensis TaxID=1915074 RepID=A0A1V2ESC2_9SPHN|nr:DUF3861 domain-containing protein [Sphingomonas jeddahensis]ONF95198.1 hypothetical protein SPHI_26180 [Sphingomonas jeddahensis]